MVNLPYEIREIADPEGGVSLELLVEGRGIARAGASADVLETMKSRLGIDHRGVVDDLRSALEDLLKNQLAKVSVSDPIEDPDMPLRFHARYTYRDHDDISTGVVWYDVNTSSTGPVELPAIVRNKMRLEVHRKLTSEGGAARALVDIHK